MTFLASPNRYNCTVKVLWTDSQRSNRWGGWCLDPPPASTAWWERPEHCWCSCHLCPWHLETPAYWHLSTAKTGHNRKPNVCVSVEGLCLCMYVQTPRLVHVWEKSTCVDPSLIIPSLSQSLRFHFTQSNPSTQSHLVSDVQFCFFFSISLLLTNTSSFTLSLWLWLSQFLFLLLPSWLFLPHRSSNWMSS